MQHVLFIFCLILLGIVIREDLGFADESQYERLHRVEEESRASLDDIKQLDLKSQADNYRLLMDRYPRSIDELAAKFELSEKELVNPWGCRYQISSTGDSVQIISPKKDCRVSEESVKDLKKETDINPVKFEMRLASETPVEGFLKMSLGRDTFYVSKEVQFANQDLSLVTIINYSEGMDVPEAWGVTPVLSKAGGEKLAVLTEKNVGKRLAMLLDGKLVGAFLIPHQLDGRARFSVGHYSKDEAEMMAKRLMAGKE